MKHLFTFLTLLLTLSFNSFGQYFEAGLFAGVSNYQGDLTPRVMIASEYAPAFGAFGRYNFTGKFAAKLHVYKGLLQGSDFHSQEYKGKRQRNLSFRSDIYEVGLQAEYNFINFNVARRDHITTPYIFAGVSGFYFNPQAEYNGQWYDLQPIGTEGQGLPGNPEKYSLMGIGIPAGIGVKFNINKLANIGMEVGLRKTFTDYLDDVSTNYPDMTALLETSGELAVALSYRTPEYDPDIVIDPSGMQRGSAAGKDWYFFGGLTISVAIGQIQDFEKSSGQPKPKGKAKMQF